MNAPQNASMHPNLAHWPQRIDLAAAFRWCAHLNMHESVANHFSLAVGENGGGSRFLINPNARHFARITASSLLEIDADDPATMARPDAPDPTAWGLHAALHRALPHATCVMHVHSIHATVLASLADSRLPPIDQNCAMFFGRHAVDEAYGGMAFEEEGARCAALLANPKMTTLVMGNHGVLVIGRSVAEAFNRLYYFERAAETYIRALKRAAPCAFCPMPWPKKPPASGRIIPISQTTICAKSRRFWMCKAPITLNDVGFGNLVLTSVRLGLRKDGTRGAEWPRNLTS